ncbi:WD40/YVTN/BNR-like repeat-containing protein [Chloroflexota bacterium]
MAIIKWKGYFEAAASTIFFVLALTLALSLPGFISTTSPAEAAANEVEWSRVNIPSGGEAGDWVLATDSDVRHLAMAKDGTLYAYANPSATSYTLFKSVDAGYSWSYTGDVKDTIVDIATAPDDAGIIYYASASSVYKSSDAGKNFIQLPPNPGGAGTANITITCINVVRLDGNSIIAVGTVDSDNTQYGGVYTLEENKLLPDWADTSVGNYDISAVAFSPNFTADRQLVAVVTDEQDTLVTSRIGESDWNQVIVDATIEGLVPISAAIAFTDDYNLSGGDYILFVAIDTGSGDGDVY